MTDDGAKPRARRRGERDETRAQEREPRTGERPARLSNGDSQPPADSGRGGRRGQGAQPARERTQNTPRGERLAPPARSGGERPHGGYRRRIVTLERSRNEHNRPIAVTVQRMYFGDWSVENLREDEPQGGGQRREGGRGGEQRHVSRQRGPQVSTPPVASQPQGPAQDGDGNKKRRRRRRRGNSRGNGGGEG